MVLPYFYIAGGVGNYETVEIMVGRNVEKEKHQKSDSDIYADLPDPGSGFGGLYDFYFFKRDDGAQLSEFSQVQFRGIRQHHRYPAAKSG